MVLIVCGLYLALAVSLTLEMEKCSTIRIFTLVGLTFLKTSIMIKNLQFFSLGEISSLSEQSKAHHRQMQLGMRSLQPTQQSRSQSFRSPWPAVGKRELWEQPFWTNKGNTRILPIQFHAVCIYSACLKWMLPELSIPATGQNDRVPWGRECLYRRKQVLAGVTLASIILPMRAVSFKICFMLMTQKEAK